jgi:hypothetical protein
MSRKWHEIPFLMSFLSLSHFKWFQFHELTRGILSISNWQYSFLVRFDSRTFRLFVHPIYLKTQKYQYILWMTWVKFCQFLKWKIFTWNLGFWMNWDSRLLITWDHLRIFYQIRIRTLLWQGGRPFLRQGWLWWNLESRIQRSSGLLDLSRPWEWK